MAQPTSNEIREKIVLHKQNEAKEEDIARWLIISKSTVTKVWALFKKTSSFHPRPRAQGRKPAVSEQTMSEIESEIKKTPDATLAELIEKFGLGITESALSQRLKKLGYSFKKRQHIQLGRTAPMSRRSAQSSLRRCEA